MSESHIGQVPWNKGIKYDNLKKRKPLTEEHKKSLRKSKKVTKQKCKLCGNYYNPGYMKSIHPKYCKGNFGNKASPNLVSYQAASATDAE